MVLVLFLPPTAHDVPDVVIYSAKKERNYTDSIAG